jgi:hypothetical protein
LRLIALLCALGGVAFTAGPALADSMSLSIAPGGGSQRAAVGLAGKPPGRTPRGRIDEPIRQSHR